MKDDEEMFRFRLKDSNRVHRRKTKEIKNTLELILLMIRRMMAHQEIVS